MVVNKPPPSCWILHIKPNSSLPVNLPTRIPNLAGSPQRVPLQPVTAKRISSSYGSSNVFTLTTRNPTLQEISNERTYSWTDLRKKPEYLIAGIASA